ncbi:MAG: hypothetical protein GY895_03270 [Phycisphaera sp.]|nr:hypothetical protein [Phycisphaera sp.]
MTRRPARGGRNASNRQPGPRKRVEESVRRGHPSQDENEISLSEGDARDRVHARLVRIAREYPDLPIGSADTSGLSPRDVGFARALEQCVLQRWNTLQAVAASKVDRDWRILQGSVRAALLAGTAELLLMDAVPDHAAINETVNRVRRHVHSGAAGLVNAVLRRIAALRGETLPADHPDAIDFHPHRDVLPLVDGRALRLTEDVFSEDEIQRLCQQTSHGEPLVVHWVAAHGLAKTRELCHHDLVRSPICMTATDPTTLEPHATEDGPLLAHTRPGFFVVTDERLDLGQFLRADPSRRIQDPASAEPVAATAGLEPALIIDYCAGRGTKTRQLAETHPQARILATDVDSTRRNDLRRAFDGHPTVEVVEPYGLAEAMGRADLLVLDVPCSNTGVLARRPEARYRFDIDNLRSIARLQKDIVRDTEPLLAPSGSILFSTCSLEPLENRKIAHWIGHHFGLDVRAENQTFPSGTPGSPPTEIHDGSFHALLTRKATETA